MPTCAQSSPQSVAGTGRYPQETWLRYATPEEGGWSTQGIAAARAYADSVGSAVGMLIHDGVVVTSWGRVDHHAEVASVAKALQSTLVGMAVERGAIDLDATLGELGIDDDPPLLPTELRARVRDLLTMRSGVFHRAVSERYDRRKPERGSREPGTTFLYHEWDPSALNAIFERASGRSFQEAFTDDLARPLGFEDFDPGNVTYVTSPIQSMLPRVRVRLSARDMARIGLLYLRNGRWGECQLVPRTWVHESTRRHVRVGPNFMGYYIWIPGEGELAEFGAYSLAGNGNVITVVPSEKVVFVHRAHSLHEGPDGSEIREILLRLLRARAGSPAAVPKLIPAGS